MLLHVIAEAEQALALILKKKVIGNAPIGIAFDPPNRPWIQALKGPTVNLFLFDIKENLHRRDVMYEDVRGPNGAVIARRPPAPRFDLHYTVTAWAPAILVEHKILAAALRCFGTLTTLPREYLPPALAALPYDVLLGTESGAKRSMFLNMGGELKGGFELTVTVAMPGLPDLPAAPAVQQAKVAVNPVPGADPARTAAARETVTAAEGVAKPGDGRTPDSGAQGASKTPEGSGDEPGNGSGAANGARTDGVKAAAGAKPDAAPAAKHDKRAKADEGTQK